MKKLLTSLRSKKIKENNLVMIKGGNAPVETSNFCVPKGCSGPGCAELDSVTEDK